MFERRGQFSRALQGRSKLARHDLRSGVVRRDGVDHFGPAQRIERPIDGGNRAFGRVALAPRITRDTPTHFGTGPTFRLPGPETSDPAAAALLDHREHGVAL